MAVFDLGFFFPDLHCWFSREFKIRGRLFEVDERLSWLGISDVLVKRRRGFDDDDDDDEKEEEEARG